MTPTTPPADEVERLRARVAELEAQLAAQAKATNDIVSRSQEKLYWLERWQIDLDTVMRKDGAEELLNVVKRLRVVVRAVRRTKRRVLPSR